MAITALKTEAQSVAVPTCIGVLICIIYQVPIGRYRSIPKPKVFRLFYSYV